MLKLIVISGCVWDDNVSSDQILVAIILGPNITQGHSLQLLVKGGYWKASVLEEGEFGLISEAVTPGFDYEDMTIASPDVLRNEFPNVWDQVAPYVAKR